MTFEPSFSFFVCSIVFPRSHTLKSVCHPYSSRWSPENSLMISSTRLVTAGSSPLFLFLGSCEKLSAQVGSGLCLKESLNLAGMNVSVHPFCLLNARFLAHSPPSSCRFAGSQMLSEATAIPQAVEQFQDVPEGWCFQLIFQGICLSGFLLHFGVPAMERRQQSRHDLNEAFTCIALVSML